MSVVSCTAAGTVSLACRVALAGQVKAVQTGWEGSYSFQLGRQVLAAHAGCMVADARAAGPCCITAPRALLLPPHMLGDTHLERAGEQVAVVRQARGKGGAIVEAARREQVRRGG